MKKIIASLLITISLFFPFSQPAQAATDIVNDATLSTGLQSCWDLNETSGTRVDDDGANDLTDNNTVTSASGKQGNAADFELSNNEFLSIASASQSPDLSLSGSAGDFSISTWVYMESKPAAAMSIVAKYGFANGNREYYLWWDNATDRFLWRVFNSTTGSDQLTASALGAPSTATWYHIVTTVDNSANTINITVNDGTVNSTALTVTTHNGGAIFYLGAVGNASPIDPWDGLMDVTAVWNKVLSASEITALYNSGNGIPCIGSAAPRRIMNIQ